MVEQQTQPIDSIFSELSTRLNEIEEKQRLLKDRILLIGENLISTKEEYEKQTIEFRNQIKQTDFEIKTLKQLNKRIIENMSEFARRSDLEILARQAKMFQPLELMKISEARKLIEEIIEKKNSKGLITKKP